MEYIKDNKKSKSPTSIRFNEAQLKIAFSKSGKKSRQQLVDWLIDRFVNGENPIQERQETIKQFQEVHKLQPIQQPSYPQISQEQAFLQECNEAKSYADLNKILGFAKKELEPKSAARVSMYAEHIRKEKGFYDD